ncbi:hypothetical protein [Embleya sp. NPDC059237]|uniref:hypothetical protein n=1 Tax=Embleya sp. NPDC059237 TaxID=3346784 RepID=UPI0036C754B8
MEGVVLAGTRRYPACGGAGAVVEPCGSRDVVGDRGTLAVVEVRDVGDAADGDVPDAGVLGVRSVDAVVLRGGLGEVLDEAVTGVIGERPGSLDAVVDDARRRPWVGGVEGFGGVSGGDVGEHLVRGSPVAGL